MPTVPINEDISKQIGQLFHNGKMPQEVSVAIKTAYAGLGNVSVAVRSSATAEDLPDASFAGQQDTYLNIQGENEVLDAVKAVLGIPVDSSCDCLPHKE